MSPPITAGVKVVTLMMVAIFLAGGGNAEEPDGAAVTDGVINATNRLRAEEGVPKLEREPVLDKAASEFARFMARTGKYGHQADGRSPSERAEAAGYEICLMAENIANLSDTSGFTVKELSASIFAGWKESKTHLENMVEPAATEIGLGLARSTESGAYYAVQLVGRPKSEMIEFEIANFTGKAVNYRLDGKRAKLSPRQIRKLGRCRPAEVLVLGLGDDGKAKTEISPADGDRLIVFRDDDDVLRVRVESRQDEDGADE
ncbi:hypothetical protein BH23VER1_BH23VER1_11360 [soil metagenome]